jgi:Putative zinc-finger
MTDPARCAEARELAPEVALGVAPAEDRARLFGHVTVCAACRDVLAELSALTDDMLALAVEHEPPTGFETHVLSRIGDKTPRRRTRRIWGRVTLLAAALVITAVVSAGAVYRAGGPDRDLAASVRATLATANGQYFTAAPLRDPTGERLGVAFGYQGKPSWVFVTAQLPATSGRSAIEVVTAAGVSRLLADNVDLVGTRGWGGTVPDPIHEIAVVRVLDADGQAVLSGRFLLR